MYGLIASLLSLSGHLKDIGGKKEDYNCHSGMRAQSFRRIMGLLKQRMCALAFFFAHYTVIMFPSIVSCCRGVDAGIKLILLTA